MDVVDTQVAIAIGTPIVASNCYDSNSSQLTLNGCSNQRREELVKQMALLVKSVLDIWQERSPEKADRFSSLQEEWENWVKRNCEFSAGLTLIDDGGVLRYEGGSMAVLLFNECLIHQYEPRLRDLQVLLYELGI